MRKHVPTVYTAANLQCSVFIIFFFIQVDNNNYNCPEDLIDIINAWSF